MPKLINTMRGEKKESLKRYVVFFSSKVKRHNLHAGLDRLGLARGIHGLWGGDEPGTVTEA
jgi:hypothetical protein